MTDVAQPRISLVIPCFNQARFLSACLESVSSQSLNDWEAIVIDDASTETDLAGVVRNLGDNRMRVIRHSTNKGLGAARNTGFREARASLVLPVDADDMLEPRFLATTVKLFEEFPETDCVFTDFQLFGDSVEVWNNTADHTLRDMLLEQWIPGAGTMMRRAVWERVGGYCEERGLTGNEDWDFWIAAVSGELNAVHIPLPLYLYRRHDASMSSFSLRYDDHLQRELLYSRHAALFDHFRLGGPFRARGYLNSAAFSWMIGKRLRALRVIRAAVGNREVVTPFLSMTARTTANVARARGRRFKERAIS